MKKYLLATFAINLIPFIVFGHEGHGTTGGSAITHYFVEPEHAIYTWSFLMASFILISYYRMRKKWSSK
jgi:hypothetical protein